ncbi:hypothetical protein JDV02_001341 [Purpureocillium takamizusanense]|uniref:Uncharacterized protein n=1 Tax=Purpureocillium takamizusanense TaxID=2060973 RepID=A0A9Q8Q815_9HYPO|nr:uncharacterized protein JDV02_001341 [Purpureocillium takamizusanense]UNI14740.1 hypothetical protein JDV02_001341 [Purpureocillium takamizusanense]
MGRGALCHWVAGDPPGAQMGQPRRACLPSFPGSKSPHHAEFQTECESAITSLSLHCACESVEIISLSRSTAPITTACIHAESRHDFRSTEVLVMTSDGTPSTGTAPAHRRRD